MADRLKIDDLPALAAVAGLVIPDEDMGALVTRLRHHLDAMAVLDMVTLDEVDAATTFDPRW